MTFRIRSAHALTLFAVASLLAPSSARGQETPPVLDSVPAMACGAACDVVTGVVYDSLVNEPLQNAIVVARPSGVTVTTDSTGRFRLTSDVRVEQLTVYHDALDRMGLGTLTAVRSASAAAWRDVRLATPSLLTIWPKLCGTKSPLASRPVILTGTARLADNRTRVAGAKVFVQWPRPGHAVGGDDPRTAESVTDSLGNFLICGMEEFVEPSLVALSTEMQSGVITLPSEMHPIRRVDLVLASVESPQRGIVRGRVVNERGAPLEAVRVSVDGHEREVMTTPDGMFALVDAPLGSRMLWVRAIGHSPVAQAVEVVETPDAPLTIVLTRTIELEGVTVTERADVRGVRRDFESRKRAGWGRFVDSTAIMKAPFVRVALQMVPGVRVDAIPKTTGFIIRGRFGCLAHLYVDGVISNNDEVNAIPPANIAAVEIYPTVAFAPAELVRVKADNCAVAAFWTKHGLRP